MNTTFFHDSTVIRYNERFYSTGQMNREKFDEYGKFFGNMSAVVKVIDLNDRNNKIINEKNEFNNVNIIAVDRKYTNTFKVVKEEIKKCDIAIIRLPSVIGSIACKYARKYMKPYLIEMVGCPKDSLWYHGGIKYKILLPLMVYSTKQEIKKSKYTVYVTKNFLQNRYPTNGKTISCSDVQIINDSDKIINARKQKIEKIDGNYTYRIGVVGSLNLKYKGHETAIKACSELKNKINFELHFLGNGNQEYWKNLARKLNIDDKLYFDEILPHNEMFEWFDNIDIFLNPSLTEGLPRALIEAMSRGCLCIGTCVGGIPELLENECIIKKNNSNELAKKIFKFTSNLNSLKDEAEKNYTKSLEYSLDKINSKKEKFYKEIINNLD